VVKVIPIPPMFSLEMPSLNLVHNLSPFSTIKPKKISTEPFPVDSSMIWIALIKDLCGLFLKEDLFLHQKCPTCGREFDEREI